jgi:hypothetical protein
MPEGTEQNTAVNDNQGPQYNINPEPVTTTVINNDGQETLPSLDPQSDSTKTVLGSSDYTGFSDNPPPISDQPIYEKSENRDIWSVKQGEKPTEVISNSDRDIKQVRSNKDERSKSIKDLDDADQHGMRVGYRSAYNTAERVKALDNLKNYDKELRSGKKLSEDEVNLLLNKELYQTKEYINHKKYIESQKALLDSKKSDYESKGLSKEDIETLMDKHSQKLKNESLESEKPFNKKKDEILNNIKDKNGNYSSSKLTIDQLSLLYNTQKETISKEFVQDRLARLDESDQRYRKKQIDEFKKENPNWSPELAKTQQERDVAKQERDLYKKALDDSTNVDPSTPQDNQDKDIIDGVYRDLQNNEKSIIHINEGDRAIETVNGKKKRDIEKYAVIAGVVAGTATTVIGGSSLFIPVAVTVAATQVTGFAAQKLGEWRQKELQKKIDTTTDSSEKEKLEKRSANWGKVIKASRTIVKFSGGVIGGAFIGSAISTYLMGGKGLVDVIGASATKEVASTATASTPQAGLKTNTVGDTTPITNPSSDISSLNPESLPSRISFSDYPAMKEGLISRGMDPNAQSLLINGTEGGWADWQGDIVRQMLEMGINPNSREAGWVIGDMAANRIPVNTSTVTEALTRAATVLGN